MGSLSTLLGLPFALGLLVYSATVTLDGRAPITDWQDPMLAGLTLFSIVLVGLTVVVLWPRLGGGGAKGVVARALIGGQWSYTFGEILSNTISPSVSRPRT